MIKDTQVLKSHRSKMGTLCVVDHWNDPLYNAPCLACWALFGWLVPWVATKPLRWLHCGDFHDYIYIMPISLLCVDSVYRGSLKLPLIYAYICYHESNVPSQLSPQWLCGNSCTWAHDVRLSFYKKCCS